MNEVKVKVHGDKRLHTFRRVEKDGKEYWYDSAGLSKKRGNDSVSVYWLEERASHDLVFHFDRYVRVSVFRKEW